MSFFDEELDDADLKFLKQWGQMGQSDTADAEYKPETDLYDEVGESENADFEMPNANGNGEAEGEIDQAVEGDEKSGEQGDHIDESKMDLSNIESGDADSTHGDLEGEDEPELDAPEDGDERLSDISDADDDELSTESDTELSDEAENRDQLKGGDTDSDIPEGEDDFEPDISNADDDVDDLSDHEHAQTEEEFGDGERANTDSEIEDLDEYEQEREEHQGKPDSSDGEGIDEGTTEPEHDSEADDIELDAEEFESDPDDKGMTEDEANEIIEHAQNELEDGLNNRDESNSGKDKNNPEDNPGDENTEELHTDSIHESGLFEELPEADHRCENHCEDNPLDDDEIEECEHCKARLEKERELWGVVAQDKHGHDLLPGDKIRVVIPMPFTTLHTILTVNVPNLEVDPQRVAQSTAGEIDPEVCWLSGHAMSNFTGWHMSHDGAIWTFKKGKKLRFAEKIGEPEFQRHGSNDLDGDQLDAEDLIEKFKQELDDHGEENQDKPDYTHGEKNDDDSEDADEPTEESDEETGDTEDEDDSDEESHDDPEDIEEHRERRNRDELTQTQKNRFENLTDRISKKIINTFGSTLEGFELTKMEDRGSFTEAHAKIVSRGVTFTVKFEMRRYDESMDKDCMLD